MIPRITLAFAFVSSMILADPGALQAGGDLSPVPNFTLSDYRGKSWSLSDFADQKVVVIAVVGTECPLVLKYLPRLEQLSQEFAKQGVAFVGINANRQDSLAEIAAQVRVNSLTFPMLKDAQQTVIAQLKAKRTPEVIVLNEQRAVRYRGRIDDQHAVGSRSRTSPTRNDLKVAIEELLAGKEVSLPETEPVGCLISRSAPPASNPSVTYANQISRLLEQHCVECHRGGEIAPFSLTSYQEAAGWADMMVEVTQSGQMPPWHASPEHGTFRNARGLSESEKKLLADWAALGAPEGDPQELPTPREFVAGWQLPRTPDYEVAVRETPYEVPAEGIVQYQYFSVDTKFTEDKWVSAAEIVPGNRAVVHHVIAFVVPGGEQPDEEHGFLTAYVPGMRIEPYPNGYAKKIPAGSKLIFQMHYTPIGTPQHDLTKIGMVFLKEADVTHQVFTENVKNTRLNILPQQDDQHFDAKPISLPWDVELLDMLPHMHLRGKSFEFTMTSPEGQKSVLLDVPHYDFNWQTVYYPAAPIVLPAGTTISAQASYDNSPANLANPNPNVTVRWGEQTWDEMLIGYFNFAVPRSSEVEATIINHRNEQRLQEHLSRLMKNLDKNQNGQIDKDEVPEKQRPLFLAADKNGDGIVSKEELTEGLKSLRGILRPRR